MSGWDAMAELEALEAQAAEGWTQEAIPSAEVQQAQLEVDRERAPFHEMTGPGYTEPPLDWDPEPENGPSDEDRDRAWRAMENAETDAERWALYQAGRQPDPEADREMGW